MNILTTEFSLEHGALEVYVAGCNARCPGCHNPESWDFQAGLPLDAWERHLALKVASPLVRAVWVLGGEPLDQPLHELDRLLELVGSVSGRAVWLFTRYELEEIPDPILLRCDYVKTGPFRQELACDNHFSHGVKLASSNQRVHRIG